MKSKKVVVVSSFSGGDLFLLGFLLVGMYPGYAIEFNKYAAQTHAYNFKDGNGDPLIRWKTISKEEMVVLKTKIVVDEKDKHDLEKVQIADREEKERKEFLKNHVVKLSNGTGRRPETIQEADGKKIRQICESLYGKNIYIVFIGGPSCQDLTKLNCGEDKGRTNLVHEYRRVLNELQPDVAIMEEASELVNKNNIDFYHDFLSKVTECGFSVGYKLVNALHYDGKQSRSRCITIMLRNDYLPKVPVFPKARPESALRSGEVLDIDWFFSGHFSDIIKTDLHYFCTVTRGSPIWLKKGSLKWQPTIDELLTIQGVKPEHCYEIPTEISMEQKRLIVGNAVPVNLSYNIAKTIMEEIFELEIKNEY